MFIAYLPQSHILGMIAELSCLFVGAQIGYARPYTLFDDSLGLSEGSTGDFHALKPTSK